MIRRFDVPKQITTHISYQDARGGRLTNTIRHNLEIYREIGYGRRAGVEE
jgi:hypothetical protein